MTDRDRLIELLKKIEYTPFPEMTMKSNLGNQFTDYALNCIVDELLANGVIVPPCKVGDVVYDICTIFDESTLKPKTIIKPRIIDFVTKVGFIIESKGLVLGEKEFGKTIFLTKEEAEEKLKECEG